METDIAMLEYSLDVGRSDATGASKQMVDAVFDNIGRRVAPIVAIVRDLAESDPIWRISDFHCVCIFCRCPNPIDDTAVRELKRRGYTVTPGTHLDTCLWLRARKLAGMG